MSESTVEVEIIEDDIPDVRICQERCEQFATLTGTDTACAQFFLQDRKWDLNTSVNAYFDAQQNQAGPAQMSEVGLSAIPFEDLKKAMSATYKSLRAQEPNPTMMKFISWNIDGLDDRSLKRRFKTLCNIINGEMPDVVHLQEIIPALNEGFEHLLPAYRCISGRTNDSEYFVVTLLRRSSVEYESHEVFDFPESSMGRNLLTVKARIAGKHLTLLNTHLESTADFSAERKNQLKTAFGKVLAVDSGRTVLFAGDLNLRDKELAQLGGVPVPLEDLWSTCGERAECRYTWDSQRNTNIQIQASFKARCRFDRMYCRRADGSPITPKYFGLIGLEKIPSCGRFPSDHWGLVSHFRI